ncbi:flagellar basal-body MS-ring/collar protein FliF [Buchnera aphidicola (Ceratovacuna keduensis)]|uniref:flagellar basal-body MS-ring/collar protein FliF n=1 Tax=Buchnera aphidicola TaxID=9 RepID=UPI0031B84B74
MNEKLSFEKKIEKNNFFKIFFNIIKKNIIVFLILVSLFLTSVFSIFFLYRSNNYCTLYNNLSNEDKNSIILELSSMNIPYKIYSSDNKIKIPRNLIYQVRMNLSEKGIPKENINGFEILDKEKFGESQFHERINYQRALEGELSKTIMKIDSIKNASVHLVINSKSIFINNDIDSSASILLTLKFGKYLDSNKIDAILHLVSTSVSGLKYKNITIVDQYGNFLNKLSDIDIYGNSKLIYINDIEQKYKKKIEEILIPLFGINNIHAQVTAQVDFDKKEKVEEHYKPNSNIFDKSIRSNQSVYSKEFHSENKNVNIKENYLKKKDDKDIKNNLNSNMSKQDINSKKNIINDKDNKNFLNNGDYVSNYDNTTNYELDHNIINTKMNVGNLKKISVGIVINYIKDSNGKFIPLNINDIEKIKCLVKNSIGFSEERGDTVDLVNSLFFHNPEIKKEKNILVEKNYSDIFFDNFLFILLTIILFIFFYEFLLKKIFFYIFRRNKNNNKNIKINNKDVNNKDVNNKDVNNKDVNNKDVNNKDVNNKDVNNKDVNDKDVNNKDVNNKDVNDKDVNDKDVNNKDVNDKDVNNKDVNDKDVNDKKYINKKIVKEKSKEKTFSNALVVTKQNKENKNIFERKSLFIAKIIRNWINKK